MKINKKIKEDLKKVFLKELAEEKRKATVFTPYKLNKQEMKGLMTIFPQIRNRSLTNRVDESLLAGVVIEYETKIIDLSIKSKLDKIYSEII